MLFLLALAVIVPLSWFVWDKRYHHGQGPEIPPGFKPTSELSIDPVDGRRLRVYYNPQTGDRLYRAEK